MFWSCILPWHKRRGSPAGYSIHNRVPLLSVMMHLRHSAINLVAISASFECPLGDA
eukprot:m.184850 g.184850  ORF g.184850 m.184850 type:complete len:56 (-) comp18491_c0_seq1:105-272(-)